MSQPVPTKRPRSIPVRVALWISNAIWIGGLLVVIAHGIWTWRASTALEKAIAEIEARGEPMSVAALQPALPPEAQNGYVELKQVMAIVTTKTDAAKAFDDLIGVWQYPLTDQERAVFETYIAERKAALPLIDRAAAKPYCVMDIQLTSPLMMMDLTELNGARNVAWWLGAEAIIRFMEGDHATAFTRLTQTEVPARAAGSYPSIVQHLAASTCRAVQAQALTRLSPELRIGVEAGAVSTGDVERVVASLLQATETDKEQLWSFQGERVGNALLIQEFGTDPGLQAGVATKKPSAFGRYVLGAALDANALASIEAITEFLQLLSSPDLPSYKSAAAVWEAKHTEEKPPPTRMLSTIMLHGHARAGEAKYRLLTDRHLAATALAVRWYRVEHGGAWPGSLETLVPKYLPEVPRDPMSAGGKIQYCGGDNPILWSVGINGTDEGGDDTRARPRDGEWQRPDRVVHLTIQPREPPLKTD